MRRALLCAALLWSCARKIEGPTPSVANTINEADPTHTPATVCNAEGDAAAGWPVDVLGDGISPLPSGTLTGSTGLVMPVVTLAGPETFELPRERVFFVDKTKLVVQMPTRDTSMAKALMPGSYSLTILNPNGNSGQMPPPALTIVPPPHIDSVRLKAGGAEIDPVLCADGGDVLVIHGENFRTDVPPAVSLGPHFLPASAVHVDSSTQITAQVAAGTFAQGEGSPGGTAYTVQVANADGCVAPYGTDARGFGVTDVKVQSDPTVTAVHNLVGSALLDPAVCKDATSATLVVDGTGFWEISGVLPSVVLQWSGGSATADSVTVTPAGTSTFSGARVTAHFTLTGAQTPGPATLTLTNANGCTVSTPVTIDPAPTLAAIVPNTVQSNVATTIELDGTGFDKDQSTGAIPTVVISKTGSAPIRLGAAFVSSTVMTAVVPAGTPGGDYDVTLTNPDGCTVTLLAALHVVSKALGVLTLDPRFGWEMKNQPITIFNQFSPPTTNGFSGAAPLVFIDAPIKGSSTVVRIPVRRVAFVDQGTISGVVPDCSGLSAVDASGTCASGIQPGGPYDIEVQDPSGSVGRIPGGFTVVHDQPPAIASINPTSITTTGVTNLAVLGAHFSSGSPAQLGSALLGAQVTGGVEFCPLPLHSGGTVSDTEIDVDVPASLSTNCYVEDAFGKRTAAASGLTLAVGLSLVRVQHAADLAFADFSGLIVTQASFNPIAGPAIATKLAEGLMDFPLVEASDDINNQFLVALGGTNSSGATANVEVGGLTKFGDVGGACSAGTCTFRLLDRTIAPNLHQGQVGVRVVTGSVTAPVARTGATAVVRQATEPCGTVSCTTSYVLLIGGAESGTPVAKVERAQVLRAADAPVLSDTVDTSGVGLLAAGSYYYRVSAVMAATDAKNPGGETLASDETPATLLSANGSAMISWSAVTGAATFKVYRTRSANDPSGTERWLASVTGSTSFTDTGARTPAASDDTPLPAGALGNWVSMASLGTARTQARAIVAGNDLWVAGGGVSGGGETASVEHIAFTAGTADFAAANWTSSGTMLKARRQHSLLALSSANSSVAAGTTLLLAVAGLNGGSDISGLTSKALEAATIGAGGATTWSSVTYTPANFGQAGGWAEAQANNLFAAGTIIPGFSLNAKSSSQGICAGSCTSPGQLSFQMNAGFTPFTINSPRYLLGEVLFRAYIYQAGGTSTALPSVTLTDTLERLIY